MGANAKPPKKLRSPPKKGNVIATNIVRAAITINKVIFIVKNIGNNESYSIKNIRLRLIILFMKCSNLGTKYMFLF